MLSLAERVPSLIATGYGEKSMFTSYIQTSPAMKILALYYYCSAPYIKALKRLRFVSPFNNRLYTVLLHRL